MSPDTLAILDHLVGAGIMLAVFGLLVSIAWMDSY
jgi:hypothetical protein